MAGGWGAAVVPRDPRPALAAARHGGDGFRVGIHTLSSLRAVVGQPAGAEDGSVHGFLQFLHRHSAAGRGEHARIPVAGDVWRRADLRAGARRPEFRAVRAAGAARPATLPGTARLAGTYRPLTSQNNGSSLLPAPL